ncbi:MAG: HNH endonuclease [Candidatus Pacebacteria bacterium]|jgi:5-methylcytosine-specific restriction endonuclease McrA|nr:HNH endonuclease [Candidatus Paceibacterota bacterium]
MQFEFPEDQEFFSHLLANGDTNQLVVAYSDLFDFRHPAIKRWEFDKTSKNVLRDLVEKYNGECQLRLHPECSPSHGLEPDHIIPLSSNILNKELRKLTGTAGAKVLSQSFGSNHPRNLTLACRKCNGLKKHKILSGVAIHRLID